MILKYFMRRLSASPTFGRRIAAGLLAISLATGVTAMEVNKRKAEDCACHGTCPCHNTDTPAEGIGRVEVPKSGISADVIDYTEGVIWGWDGRYCELWEMNLFARIAYLEFWGTSQTCCEAGVDSILRLWESGYFGDSLGAVLSAKCETGAYVYSTYAYVWDWDYDQQGLAEMRALCEERFSTGPVWTAPFFQLWYYPAWAVPCYQIGNVFFSTGKGW